jgi:hypothetical protein
LNTGVQVRETHTSESFSIRIEDAFHSERRPAGQQLIELARIVKLEAERTGNESRKKVGSYRGFVVWLRAKSNRERSMQALLEDSTGGVDILLDYNVPQLLVAHVSESDTGTIASMDAAIRSLDGEINKSVERREYLAREVQTLETLLKEAWEHAERLETLAGKLALLDQELIAAGISMEKEQDLDQTKADLVEIDALDDVVDESAKESVLNFDLNAILDHIDELHASMQPMEQDEDLAIRLPASDGILVTPQAVEALARQGESALVMAEFGRSVLSGTQMRLTDLLDLGQTNARPLKKSASKKKQLARQLRLF